MEEEIGRGGQGFKSRPWREVDHKGNRPYKKDGGQIKKAISIRRLGRRARRRGRAVIDQEKMVLHLGS